MWLSIAGSGRNWRAEAGDVYTNGAVATGLQAILDMLAQSRPLAVKYLQGKEVVDDMGMAALGVLDRSPVGGPQQFVAVLAASLKLYGPAYFVIDRHTDAPSDAGWPGSIPVKSGQAQHEREVAG